MEKRSPDIDACMAGYESIDEKTFVEGFDLGFETAADYYENCGKAVGQMEEIRVFLDFGPAIIPVCLECGRNASCTWWKCCPLHVEDENGPEVICQSCVEKLHPNDPEFARE